MRYVHPQANAVPKLFVRLSELNREKLPVRGFRVRAAGAKSGAAGSKREQELQ
jgi:hypothetical protein